MASEKYFSFNHTRPLPIQCTPADAIRPIVSMNGDDVPGCLYYQACWLMKDMEAPEFMKHDSDELLLFIGSDKDDHENLNATVELWIENDKLTITETCIIFIPKGTAHGKVKITGMTKPIIHYSYMMTTSYYQAEPAVATAPEGTFTGNVVYRYEPVDGYLPPAPEGFLTRLIWLDGAKLAGAPYMEAVWFHTKNETGPENHFHDFDEIVGFLGSDPEHPELLNGDLSFLINDETIPYNESCVVFVPRGVTHSPILVPRLDKSLIHFSGGNGGDYARKDEENGEDIFRTDTNSSK